MTVIVTGVIANNTFNINHYTDIHLHRSDTMLIYGQVMCIVRILPAGGGPYQRTNLRNVTLEC